MPFFAQIQTNGGKDGYSAEGASKVMQRLGIEDPKLVNPDDVTVPPQYPDISEMREMVANQLNTMPGAADRRVGVVRPRCAARSRQASGVAGAEAR